MKENIIDLSGKAEFLGFADFGKKFYQFFMELGEKANLWNIIDDESEIEKKIITGKICFYLYHEKSPYSASEKTLIDWAFSEGAAFHF